MGGGSRTVVIDRLKLFLNPSVHFHFLYSGTCLIRNFLDPTKSLYTNECFTMHFNPSNPTIW